MFVFLIAISAFASVCILSGANSPKHILFVITDDQAFSDIGYRDSTFATPTIDALANSGIKLERFYTQTSCSPARSSLMTGLYTHMVEMGEQFPFNHGDNRVISLDHTFLPEYLKKVGYRTVGVGKWHLGMKTTDHLPTSRGFDSFFGNMDAMLEHYNLQAGFACTAGHNPYCQVDNGFTVLDNGKPATEFIGKNEYYTEIIGNKAVEAVDNHDPSQPLFLYFAAAAPHGPLQAPQKYVDRCQNVVNPPDTTENGRTMICAKLAAVDDAIFNITAALERKNMINDTLIIYMSDNGGIISNGAINGDFRGQKASFFEGGVRTPAFVSGKVLNNFNPVDNSRLCSSFDGIVHVTDLFATVLKYANSDAYTSGVGYPLFADNSMVGCPTIQRTELELGIGGLKYSKGSSAMVFIRDDHIWKYTRVPDIMTKYFGFSDTYTNATYLFDLTVDPQETTNLYSEQTQQQLHQDSKCDPYCILTKQAQLHGEKMTLSLEKKYWPTFLDKYGCSVEYTPTTTGCWLPTDSEYIETADCQLNPRRITFPVPPPQF